MFDTNSIGDRRRTSRLFATFPIVSGLGTGALSTAMSSAAHEMEPEQRSIQIAAKDVGRTQGFSVAPIN